MRWIFIVYICACILNNNKKPPTTAPYISQTRRPFRLQRVYTLEKLEIPRSQISLHTKQLTEQQTEQIPLEKINNITKQLRK